MRRDFGRTNPGGRLRPLFLPCRRRPSLANLRLAPLVWLFGFYVNRQFTAENFSSPGRFPQRTIICHTAVRPRLYRAMAKGLPRRMMAVYLRQVMSVVPAR